MENVTILIIVILIFYYLLRPQTKTKTKPKITPPSNDKTTTVSDGGLDKPKVNNELASSSELIVTEKPYTFQRTENKGNSVSGEQYENPYLGDPQEGLRKMAFIWQVNTTDLCQKCKKALQREKVNLAVYPSQKHKENILYFIADIYSCTQCRYICSDEHEIIKMKEYVGSGWLDVRDWGASIISNMESSLFQWPSTYAMETSNYGATERNFENQSELHKLGYKITGVSRQRRWRILEDEALPKLGLEKVANIIASNVKARESQKNGRQKFSYAISEWEHDLSELKKHYYRRNFTWPRID